MHNSLFDKTTKIYAPFQDQYLLKTIIHACALSDLKKAAADDDKECFIFNRTIPVVLLEITHLLLRWNLGYGVD